MKNYLVTVNLGADVIRGFQVSVGDTYIPSSDNMKKLKDKVVKQYKPQKYRKYAAHSDCGGYINRQEVNGPDGYWKSEELNVVGVSNLDV